MKLIDIDDLDTTLFDLICVEEEHWFYSHGGDQFQEFCTICQQWHRMVVEAAEEYAHALNEMMGA